MDITPLIRELLFGHDCVILPGFGGFIGNYTPARIDKSTSTFYPPVKQISFNRNLSHNDGLLTGRISAACGIPYGDARNILEEFVAGIRKKLERGEKVVFDNIGSLVNNHEGNIQFEPDRNVNYHLDSYGLESFRFSPLEEYDVRKRITRHIDKEPVKHSLTRKILWRAAVIVPLLALMVVVPLKTNLFKSRAEASNLNPLATAEFEDNRKAIEQSRPEIKIDTETGTVPEQTAVPSIATAGEKKEYYIITGSFRLKENAETLARKLAEEGYSPEIISAPNGFFRVSALSCSTLNDAEERKISISVSYPGSWVKKIR